MNLEEVREYALSLPSVTEDMPFGPDVVTFRIGGRIFMAFSLDSLEPKCAIKLSPEFGIELRERYEWVQPAYHWNKKYWNDIYIDKIDNAHVKQWIKMSYEVVLNQLSKKIRASLEIYPK